MASYRVDILTLFPEMFDAPLHESIIGRAEKKGILEIQAHQIRDYTHNKQNQVDDYPYGGGFGCVMMAQPLKSCLEAVQAQTKGLRSRVIYMSPQGQPFDQKVARRLKQDYDHLVLVCGHYEGVDERFIELCVDEELSLGDFVLTGGEIAAMAVTDAVCRMVPGVLADEECYTGESHWDGLLEYPQYTRPEVWEGLSVPEVLLEGDHSKVSSWRRMQQLERTQRKRPDMFQKLELADPEDIKLLKKLEKQQSRIRLSRPVSWAQAQEQELDAMLEIVAQARAGLKKHRVDQWQGSYPARADLEADLAAGELFSLYHGEELAGFFVLSQKEEPAYSSISDGRWTEGISYGVLHRCAIADKYKGSGISKELIRASQERCRELGLRSIRSDTHKKNKPMQQLLRDNGFRYRGNVLVEEEGHDPRRQAFEKILKKERSEK